MLTLRYAYRWRLGGIVLVALTLTLALAPPAWFWPSGPGVSIPHLDKWLHGLTFLVLAAWYCGQFAPHAYWRLAAGLFAFGALIELTQGLVSYRSADWLDLAADGAGILVGLAIALAGLGGWCLRVENWLDNRVG